MIRHGEIVFINEIVEGNMGPSTVRVSGRIYIDTSSQIFLVSWDDSTMRILVNTQGLGDQNSYIIDGSLLQCIGEIEDGILIPRVVRNIDGMDMNLYKRAVMQKRKFEKDYMGT
eukprot:TRINITY_DN1058_c0_g1_i1.p1 TRINITY_DN1058_c0_g1~~TRINITY_DN1058_c0_g1_i1.p1  ORF type:complete len:114 (-),score=21.14 TRINITY_DN1058_c0_g1_i1:63-404(-)